MYLLFTTSCQAEDDDLNEGEDVEHAGRESAATTGSLGEYLIAVIS